MMKNVLLGSTALVCLSLVAGAAQAACTTTAPTTGQTVDCTGTSTTPIVAGANQNNVTITMEDASRLNTAAAAILVNSTNTLHLLGSGQINTTGDDHDAFYGIGDDNNVDLNGTSLITTTGNRSAGVHLRGTGTITLNDQSKISTTGLQAAGIRTGDATTVTLNGQSQVKTTGDYSHGIDVGVDSVILLNGTNYAVPSVLTAGKRAYGIEMARGNSQLRINNHSVVKTTGQGADAVEIRDFNGNTVVLNDQGSILTTGDSAGGIYADLSDHNTITLNANTNITTRGKYADGIKFQRSSYDSVVMNGISVLLTYGQQANGITANGDHTSVTLNDNSLLETFGLKSYGIRFGGNDDRAFLAGTAHLQTRLDNSSGIVFGAANESASLMDDSVILTEGQKAYGIDVKAAGDAITLNGRSSIITTGQTAHGVNVTGDQVRIALGDESRIGTTGTSAAGIAFKGNSGRVDLNGNSQIITSGLTADGILFNGTSNFVFLHDGSVVRAEGTGSFGVNFAAGGSNVLDLRGSAAVSSDHATAIHTVAGSNFNDIFLNDASTVTANSDNIAAVQLNSNFNILETNGTAAINAGGANAIGLQLNNANNSLVILSGHSSINTTGANSTTVLVQGTDNELEVLEQSRVTATGANATAISLSGALNSLRNRGTVSASNGVAILGDNNAANGDDIINNGLISSGGGNAPISLRAGDDTLALGTGSQINGGAIDGGAGNDTLALFGRSSEDDAFANFETLNVIADLDNVSATDWSLSGTSTFATKIDIRDGRLRINGAITSPVTTVRDAGILGGNGTLTSNVTSTGHIAPGNSVGTVTINGNFTQTGGAFDVETDSHGVDRLNVLGAGGATLAGGPALNIIPLDGNTGGAGIILHAPNGITGTFGTVNFAGNGAVDLVQTATDISLITVDGTPVVAGDFAATEAGLDYLDSVGDEQLAGLESCGTDTCDRAGDQRKHLWAKAFGRFGNEAASAGNQAFDFRIAGTAMGGDMVVSDSLRLGAAFGYSNTEENVTKHAAGADINTTQLGLYANYQKGPYFVTGLVSGGWQSFDLSRQVGGGGAGEDEADASTHGWLFGSSLQAGAQFRFPKGWMLTPSAGVSYQHQWVNGTTEHGGGAADVDIASHQSDAIRLKAQLVLSQDYQLTNYTITPHLKVGVQQQFNLGGKADGTFSDGTDFALDLIKTDRTIGVIGLGVGVGFQNGLSTYVDYDGAMASGRTVHSITGGLRYSW